MLWNKFTPTRLVEYIFAQHPVVFEVGNGFNPNRPEYASLDASGLQHALRGHPDLDVKWVHRIAQIPNTSLVWSLLNHPNITPEILDLMAQVYIGYLAQHPHPDPGLPEPVHGLQAQLIKSAKFTLADLSGHPKTSPKTMLDLIEGIKQTTLIPYSIKKLCESPHEQMRSALPEVLEATRANHMASLSDTHPVSDVLHALAELTEFAALSVVSQQRILQTVGAAPQEALHGNTAHRFKQSPHSLIRDYFAEGDMTAKALEQT